MPVTEHRTMIEISGAKQNNLKNISVKIPRDRLTVITGVSGSGKSSLAFDVIYGEAQRRFLESVSNFAKGRINQVKKPKVDFVRGLSPVIAIEQKKGNDNPRSTVGTVTDINDYLRLLYATAGIGKCPYCGQKLTQRTAAQIAEHIAGLPNGTVVELRAPLYKASAEDYNYLFTKVREKGYKNLLIDGEPLSLTDKYVIDETVPHDMEIVIDRFTVLPNLYIQIAKTIDAAMTALSEDIFLRVEILNGEAGDFFKGFGCPEHHYILHSMQPFHFSFNVPTSACPTCEGVGSSFVAEPRFMIVNAEKSIMKGALSNTVFSPVSKDSYHTAILYSLSQKYDFSLDTPFNRLPEYIRDIIFYGTKGEPVKMLQPPFASRRNWIVGREVPFNGFVNDINNWYRGYLRRAVTSEAYEPKFVKEMMIEKLCPDCKGARLRTSRLNVTLAGKSINELCDMQFPELIEFLSSLTFNDDVREVSENIIHELTHRLQLLCDVGLYYLNLGRRSDTVSGGEMQRLKMSTQISSELMGMLYVMDEPSIGLHARDSVKVINIMKQLRDIGNTVIVVEHDLETMRNADYLVELGPGAGVHGGNLIAEGTSEQLAENPNSLTGMCISGRSFISVPTSRRHPTDICISIQGARSHNLKNLNIDIPLGLFICVTGVSGSGKSTLINDTLFKQLEIIKKSARIEAGECDYIFGAENISSVINVDQSAIGRTSKSNPATYIGLYDRIRDLFAATEDAKEKGYTALDFSLTHANGTRCEHCTGDGVITTSLQFMADIETVCPVCKGRRFTEEGLEIKYHGKSIADVLEMTVEEALEFFADNNYLRHKLGIVNELGLGYIRLGQSSTTISGGEAQRVKLSYELAKLKRGAHNLYILDEPTTGLHITDIQKLLDSINRLVDKGHTVMVIEHNLDVIKSADYVIDMGPEGGAKGGYVVAAGTPEEVSMVEESYTGQYLKGVLNNNLT